MAFIIRVERNTSTPSFFRFGGNTCRLGLTQAGFLTLSLPEKWLGVLTALKDEEAAPFPGRLKLEVSSPVATGGSNDRSKYLWDRDTMQSDTYAPLEVSTASRYPETGSHIVSFTAETNGLRVGHKPTLEQLKTAEDIAKNNTSREALINNSVKLIPGERISLPPLSYLLVQGTTLYPMFIPDQVVSAAASLVFGNHSGGLYDKTAAKVESTPHLFVSLVGNAHSYPLMPGVRYTVGSTDEDLLYVDLPTAGCRIITIEYARFDNTSGKITVSPREGVYLRMGDVVTAGALELCTVPTTAKSNVFHPSDEHPGWNISHKIEALPAGLTIEIRLPPK